MILAFATVGAIEFRTVLSMLGLDVATGVYYPIVGLVIALIAAALVLLPDGEEPTSDEGGSPEGNPSEA